MDKKCQKEQEMIPLGSEFKMGVHLCPIRQDGAETLHLADLDFDCVFSADPNKKVVQKKEQLVEIDEDNYIAMLDSTKLGEGVVRCMLRLEIPDSDFPNGKMKKWLELVSNTTIYGKKH